MLMNNIYNAKGVKQIISKIFIILFINVLYKNKKECQMYYLIFKPKYDVRTIKIFEDSVILRNYIIDNLFYPELIDFTVTKSLHLIESEVSNVKNEKNAECCQQNSISENSKQN